ncbi:hypothetical protein H4CHR_03812 [Variovorax sp. PBS-H4]|uniref:hypothetical protein n=1 Tax=Variovorax sp. PBS-H4 TaxID=434008 RepID=UPI0013184932|nr:hypothetical protein [Variovorax sp. PBS-H4]VTU36036.1 hypothetical protein H4CHR_03812 [Variovorax sp. PBS-H4]
MSKRIDEIETEPHALAFASEAGLRSTRTFARTVSDFFRRSGGADTQELMVAKARHIGQAALAARTAQEAANSALYKHWDVIKEQGITASQFIAFLQPLADLEGITVSYTYLDEDGTELVYNHRGSDVGTVNPLSLAIREKKLSREKALTFALNEEGRVWIESNFIELGELK